MVPVRFGGRASALKHPGKLLEQEFGCQVAGVNGEKVSCLSSPLGTPELPGGACSVKGALVLQCDRQGCGGGVVIDTTINSGDLVQIPVQLFHIHALLLVASQV